MEIYYWDMEATFSDFNIPEALMQYGMILQININSWQKVNWPSKSSNLNIGSFAVLKSFENIPKHSWNARKSQGDPHKSYEELGIFGGFRLSQFVSSLSADHYFWCSWGVPGCFEGVPGYYGMFQGCSGVVPGCFRGVPGCSGGVPGFADTQKVLLSSLHMNGHTLEFHPQTQKLEQLCTA